MGFCQFKLLYMFNVLFISSSEPEMVINELDFLLESVNVMRSICEEQKALLAYIDLQINNRLRGVVTHFLICLMAF